MKNTQNDVETANKRLGETIKALRERLGITQEQLSERAQIDKSQLFDLENGNCNSISIETLIAICPYLNVSLDYMLIAYVNTDCVSDREYFYDFEGNEIDLYKIGRNLYLADAEFVIMLSSADFLGNKELITKLKEIMISNGLYLKVSPDYMIDADCVCEREHFYDLEGNEIDVYSIARNLYSVDAEFLILLSSANFLDNNKLIAELKETMLSSSKN